MTQRVKRPTEIDKYSTSHVTFVRIFSYPVEK